MTITQISKNVSVNEESTLFAFDKNNMPDVINVSGDYSSGKSVTSFAMLLDIISSQPGTEENPKKVEVISSEITCNATGDMINHLLKRYGDTPPENMLAWLERHHCNLTVRAVQPSNNSYPLLKTLVEEIRDKKPDIVLIDQADLVTKFTHEMLEIAPLVIINCGYYYNVATRKPRKRTISIDEDKFNVLDVSVTKKGGILRLTENSEYPEAYIDIKNFFRKYRSTA